MAVVNLANTSVYGTISTETIPTLLRNSCLYDLVSDKPVKLSTYWLAQGYPHPAVACGSELRHPFGHLLSPTDTNGGGDGDEPLSENEQRVLLGNGMHVAMVGSWLVYCLACSVQTG